MTVPPFTPIGAELPGFWDRFGMDEGGLPAHLPMEVDINGDGPADVGDQDHMRCWCSDPKCPLTLALLEAHKLGRKNIYF